MRLTLKGNNNVFITIQWVTGSEQRRTLITVWKIKMKLMNLKKRWLLCTSVGPTVTSQREDLCWLRWPVIVGHAYGPRVWRLGLHNCTTVDVGPTIIVYWANERYMHEFSRSGPLFKFIWDVAKATDFGQNLQNDLYSAHWQFKYCNKRVQFLQNSVQFWWRSMQ